MKQHVRKAWEGVIHAILLACALLSVLTTFGILLVLVSESLPFFRQVSLWNFLGPGEWAPEIKGAFSIWPLLTGTLLIAGGALLLAVPVGMATAIFLSEYAAGWMRQILKPLLEVLAGIPSVVYGYFAVTVLTPAVIKPLFPDAGVFNAASAAIVVAIMIIPTIASLCDDAFRAVPRSLREGAYALAATKLEVSTRVVLPSAISGVVAAVLLGLGRAIGETMAVAMAAGMTPKLTLNPLESVQTLTAAIVKIATGDTPVGTIEYRTIFVLGLALFLITLGVNLAANRIVGRIREAYE